MFLKVFKKNYWTFSINKDDGRKKMLSFCIFYSTQKKFCEKKAEEFKACNKRGVFAYNAQRERERRQFILLTNKLG